MRQPRGKLAQTRANSWTPPKLVTPSTKRRHMPRPSHHGRATAGRQRAAAMPRASTGQQDRRAAGRRPTRVTKALLGTPRASAEEPRAAAMHQDRPVQALACGAGTRPRPGAGLPPLGPACCTMAPYLSSRWILASLARAVYTYVAEGGGSSLLCVNKISVLYGEDEDKPFKPLPQRVTWVTSGTNKLF